MTRRLLETLAMAAIGDGVLCMISPRRHTGLWLSGPEWWRRAWAPFVEHSTLTRLLGAVGVGFGLWLAWRQEPAAAPSGARAREAEGNVHYLLRRSKDLLAAAR